MAHPGQPTLYREDFCDRVIELGKQGFSVIEMCADIGISKQTIYDWTKANPEFLDAFTQARLHSQAWWESQGRESLGKAIFQSSLWSRSMAARFPEDWRESKQIELTESPFKRVADLIEKGIEGKRAES
jgi:hypothetical protein